ncbi:reverse transcriptase family protein [Mannheimia indoligenes]|uniref:reverse transcriptase family protein n=1 Tax=Mannheimia indoligenes TaxID=3103145 RepID=UPI002FE6C0D5
MFDDSIFNRIILQNHLSLRKDFHPKVIGIKINKNLYFSINSDIHRDINKRIVNYILSDIPVNSSACAYIKGKSYLDFLSPHCKNCYFLRLDIKNFFHSFPERILDEFLLSLFNNEKPKGSDELSSYELARLVLLYKCDDECSDDSIKGRSILPIGFPSSPIISNILFRKIDILIEKYCYTRGITYTRYADDMLFSSKSSGFLLKSEFEREMSFLISLLGFRLNNNKTIRSSNELSLNGYVIYNYIENNKSGIRLSNKKLSIIRKVIYYKKNKMSNDFIMRRLFNIHINNFKFKYGKYEGFFEKYCEDQIQHKIRGFRSFLLSFSNYSKENYGMCEEYIELVNELEKYII